MTKPKFDNRPILLRPAGKSTLRKQLDAEAKKRSLRSGNQAAVVLLEEFFAGKLVPATSTS